MSRKIQPEQTKANILAVSEKLFIEKGYEKTTTQEIVDLTGLSKGTVFHHFKTKEEILLGVLNQHMDTSIAEIEEWLAGMTGMTAREKLMRLFDEPDATPEEERETMLFRMAIMTQSPHIHMAEIKKSHHQLAPLIADLMREGIEDGSINTAFPDECAQLFMLFYAIWTDPMTLACTLAELEQRLRFIQHTMKVLGVDIVSERFMTDCMTFAENLLKEEN
ncbi:MAG: TetR/AcrR family transcriptional regulator [Turicibacter sp.]|nr:TetR/AcrR family transcriptional regulator [Turicibacter sp.]